MVSFNKFYFKNILKIDVKASDKALTEHIGAMIINLYPGCVCRQVKVFTHYKGSG